jgi:hypothetical protein
LRAIVPRTIQLIKAMKPKTTNHGPWVPSSAISPRRPRFFGASAGEKRKVQDKTEFKQVNRAHNPCMTVEKM